MTTSGKIRSISQGLIDHWKIDCLCGCNPDHQNPTTRTPHRFLAPHSVSSLEKRRHLKMENLCSCQSLAPSCSEKKCQSWYNQQKQMPLNGMMTLLIPSGSSHILLHSPQFWGLCRWGDALPTFVGHLPPLLGCVGLPKWFECTLHHWHGLHRSKSLIVL